MGETLAVWTEFNMPGGLAFGQDMIYVADGGEWSIWTPERRMIARFAPDVAGKGSLNIHSVRIEADEIICRTRSDRAVTRPATVPA